MAKEDRRNEILLAAAKTFFAKGFEGTKMEDIAKAAGIGKGTVYEYFESKQHLFEEMVTHNREIHLKNIQKALAKGETFREKFIFLALYQTSFVKEHFFIFDLLGKSKLMAREMGAVMMDLHVRVTFFIKNVLDEAVQKGELRSDLDTEIAAGLVIGVINQYCNKRVIFNGSAPEDIDYNKVADTLLNGLK